MNNSAATLNASCSPFDANIFTTAAIVSAVGGFISLLASSFIIFIIILFKKWRFFSQRLVFYLAITAAIYSLSAILLRADYENQRGPSYSKFCIFSGYLEQISSWMVLDAIICITVSLLLKSFSRFQPERCEVLFILLIFFLPFSFNWIPFIKQAYGKSGAWCWIRSMDNDTCEHFVFGQILQLLLWYLPLYILIFVLLVFYVLVVAKVHRIRKRWTGKYDPVTEHQHKEVMKELVSLLAYPLIYFLINIPPLINRIHGAVQPHNPQPVLWFLSSIFFSLQGGIIALAFSLDPQTRRRLTVSHFRAAMSGWWGKEKIEEYPINRVTLTESFIYPTTSSSLSSKLASCDV